MGLFSDYLLISDFDLTLTDRYDQIPAANRAAVETWMAEGGAYTVATGRSLKMAWSRLRDFPRNAPLITFNGAACSEPTTGELYWAQAISPQYKALLRPLLIQYPRLRLELQSMTCHYVFNEDPRRDQYLQSQEVPFTHRPLDDIDEDILKFSLSDPSDPVQAKSYDSPMAAFFRELTEELNRLGAGFCEAVNSRPNAVEVQSNLCSKGKSARALADRLGRKYLVTVGDSANDRSMLLEADFGFCTGECDPELPALGIPQVEPCGEGSVAGAIRRMMERK